MSSNASRVWSTVATPSSVRLAPSATTFDDQRARSHEAAMAELRRCAGTQFDPAVVAALEAELSPGFVADVAVTTAPEPAAPPSRPRRPLRGRSAR